MVSFIVFPFQLLWSWCFFTIIETVSKAACKNQNQTSQPTKQPKTTLPVKVVHEKTSIFFGHLIFIKQESEIYYKQYI
jgi:predicted ferric reductase